MKALTALLGYLSVLLGYLSILLEYINLYNGFQPHSNKDNFSVISFSVGASAP